MDWHDKLTKALSVATEAARDAGLYVMQELPGLRDRDISEKGPGDFVTKIDHASEAMIRGRIARDFPKDGFLAEESGGDMPDAECVWVVDPLDGTNNYIHRFPHFSVSIAMLVDGRPEVGVIYDPTHNQLFACKRSEGVWLNDVPITASRCREMGKAFVGTGFPSRYREQAGEYARQFRAVLEKVSAVRRSGSAALDLAYVACGRYDGFWEPRLGAWDMAAGALLVGAAGGIVTDEAGKPWEIGSKGVIAGNRFIHPELVRLVSK